MLSKNVETLKNMNGTTAKYAKWFVRVLDPKVVEYSFQSKGERVAAEKFQCVLVSSDPKQYMMGLVPFDFKDRRAAANAAEKFTADSVWELLNPTFDAKSKPEFNGCPVKGTVLLSKPTVAKRVLPTSQEALNYPARGLHIPLAIAGIMKLLRGPGTASRLTFDFSGKFLSISKPKQRTKGAAVYNVADAEFMDPDGSRIAVGVWQGAKEYFSQMSPGTGVAVVGATAAKEEGEVKVNIWPSAHVSTTGEQAQSLTSQEVLQGTLLTPTFTPGRDVAGQLAPEAHPTCAAALADSAAKAAPITFQINRCILDPPLQEEAMYTQDGRLFLKNCRLRDGTGAVDVDVVGAVAPSVYGCADADEVRAALGAQSLTGVKDRCNVRGVLREEGGAARRYILEVHVAPLDAKVSMLATRLCKGLSSVVGEVVLPAPASRVVDDPLVGMAARRDDDVLVGAHRLLLLVKGRTKTTLDPIDPAKPFDQQVFKVSSQVDCLLSDTPVKVNLVGYCDFAKMLTYRLDTESALVLVSAVERAVPSTPGVAGDPADSGLVCTVEHVTKLSKDELAGLTVSLAAEWKAILTNLDAAAAVGTPPPASSADPSSPYWSEERQRKVRRVLSEPQSPLAPALALAQPREPAA